MALAIQGAARRKNQTGNPVAIGLNAQIIFGQVLAATLPFLLANVNSRSRSLSAIDRSSVPSAALVHRTQPVEIFGNISTAFGTLAIP